jgi:hypothetical protein
MKSALPLPHPQVLFTEIDDGSGVLLHLDTKFYFTLNPTGALVWKALAARSADSVEALGAMIAARFRVDAATAARDAEALLAELAEGGLVELR